MGRVCFLTGVFLLKSVSMVMDRCGFEQDRRNNFHMMYIGEDFQCTLYGNCAAVA